MALLWISEWVSAAMGLGFSTALLYSALTGRDRSLGAQTNGAVERETRATCACCGYPTQLASLDNQSCILCEWERPEAGRGDAGALARARTNFKEHLTSYSPAEAEKWGGTVGAGRLREAKQALIRAYDDLIAAGDAATEGQWRRMTDLEWKVIRLNDDGAKDGV